MKPLKIALVALLSLTTPVLAATPLNQNTHITEWLVAGRVGDMIRKTCPSITARMFVVLGKMEELKTYAIGQGYTEAEVKIFLKNKDEKTRIRTLADEYLAVAGTKAGDAESYCRAGRDEIVKGSLIGSLLRSWQ